LVDLRLEGGDASLNLYSSIDRLKPVTETSYSVASDANHTIHERLGLLRIRLWASTLSLKLGKLAAILVVVIVHVLIGIVVVKLAHRKPRQCGSNHVGSRRTQALQGCLGRLARHVVG